MTPQNLIRFIASYATEQGAKLTTVQLVKFVYLADLYYARKEAGKTLTNFPWAFIYYGPYCSNVMSAIAGSNLKREFFESTFDTDKEYSLYSLKVDDSSALQNQLPISVIFPLQHAIKKFIYDTADLLDFVYFETEPMLNAKKGDVLDFSLAKPLEATPPVQLRQLSKKKIEQAKKYIDALKQKRMRAKANLKVDHKDSEKWYDQVYHDAISAMSSNDLDVGLSGTAKIIN